MITEDARIASNNRPGLMTPQLMETVLNGTAINVLHVKTFTDLKNIPIANGPTAMVLSAIGGFYSFDPLSTAAEETAHMSVVKSNLSVTGRWLRIFQKGKTLPQGQLFYSGEVRTLFATGPIVGSGGEFAVNLTEDNTTGGAPLFGTILSNQGYILGGVTGPNTVIQSSIKTQAIPNIKLTTHIFYRPNVLTLALGVLYSPFLAVPAGTQVTIRVEGTAP